MKIFNFNEGIESYLKYLRLKDYAKKTISKRKHFLKTFYDWCSKRNILEFSNVTKETIEKYHKTILGLKKKDGSCQGFDNQRRYLSCVHDFFSFLAEKNQILINPTEKVNLPIVPASLPSEILSQIEIKRILRNTEPKTNKLLRDRAILELLYATAVRKAELMNLDIADIDFDKQRLLVRCGKGKKDRMLPLTKRSINWLNKYLVIRNNLENINALFLSTLDNRISPTGLSNIIKRAVARTNIKKKISCHSFRHSLATHLLDNGCDIRHIQELLGHSSLFATQIYTRVSVVRLKEVHKKTHPFSK